MDRQQQGFTLIELVVTLVIMGTLAAYGAVNWPFGDATVQAQAEQIARDLRHAQAIAMTQNRQLTFTTSSSSYAVSESGATIDDPAGSGPFSQSLDDGVTVSGGPVAFDGLGRPLSGGSLTGSTISFLVSGNTASMTVNVTPVTGFVTVAP